MSTYTPALYPRRPKHSTVFSELRYRAQLAYYRYELHTGLYVCSEPEKWALNLVILSLLVLLWSAVYFYLPRTTVIGLQRLAYYITGNHAKINVSMTQMISHRAGESVASLADTGSLLNTSTVLAP